MEGAAMIARWMKMLGVALFVGGWLAATGAGLPAQTQKVIVVVGAAGAEEYGNQFKTWAAQWKSAIERSGDGSDIELTTIGLDENESPSDAEHLKQEISNTPKSVSELWIVLIGHGTDDRKRSKFNLRGSDVTANELNEWLDPLTCRLVVINCSSASGAFINKLKSPNRIVITATKSGAQHNYARFGGYLAEAIGDETLDLDKDQQTSLLEAFIAASARTQEFYVEETRLASELAMIDDNGDGLGTPADWFEGTRVVRKSKNGEPDGVASNQVFLIRRGIEAQLSPESRQARDQLEVKLEKLRMLKATMETDAYYRAMEPILFELAKIYDSCEP